MHPRNWNCLSQDAEKKKVLETFRKWSGKFKIQVEAELERPGKVDVDAGDDDDSGLHI